MIAIIFYRMYRPKKKQKNTIDKDFQDQVKEVKNLLTEGKTLIEDNKLDQALNMLNKAIAKASSIQVANSYLLYYYRGICYLEMGNLEKAQRDFIESSSLADEKGKVQVSNALGNCKIRMAEQDPSYLQESVKCFENAIRFSKFTDGESYLNLANIYRRLNNNYKAIEQYKNAVKYLKSEQLYEALTKRGLCYREIGEIENSIDDFTAALDLCGEDPSSHFNLGVNYLLVQKSELAQQKFDDAIKYSEKEQVPQYHNYKGLALYMSGNYEQCVSMYQFALKLYGDKNVVNSEVAECWYNLGNAHLKLNHQQQAIKAYDNAKKYQTPADLYLKIQYSEGLAYSASHDFLAVTRFKECQEILVGNITHKLYQSTLYHLGANLHFHKKYQEAIKALSTLVDQGCEDQCVFQMRGKVYLDAQMYQEALKDFNVILSMDQNYPEVYYYLGMCKSHLLEIDASIADFFKAFQLGSRKNCILNGISCAYLKSGRAEKSLVYANLALDKEPDREQFLIQRSMVYIQLGEYQKAIQDLSKATRVNSQNPVTYYQRGIAFYKNSQFESAIKDLKKSFNCSPHHTIQADIQYLIGICHSSLQQFELAVQPFTNAIKLQPQPRYYHERAKCYLLLDQNEQALRDLNTVVSEQPQNAFAYFRRAFAFKALKKYQDSADDFMKARELSPDDPRLIVNKKQIYNMKYRKLCEAGQEQ